jgi:hypothetical protein
MKKVSVTMTASVKAMENTRLITNLANPASHSSTAMIPASKANTFLNTDFVAITENSIRNFHAVVKHEADREIISAKVKKLFCATHMYG